MLTKVQEIRDDLTQAGAIANKFGSAVANVVTGDELTALMGTIKEACVKHQPKPEVMTAAICAMFAIMCEAWVEKINDHDKTLN